MRYSNVLPAGEFEGQLNNSGEKISLFSPLGTEILSVKYKDSKPWPKIADGTGFSLVSTDNNLVTNPNLPEYWSASSVIHGSPGAANIAANILPVLVNEIRTNAEMPDFDAIELYNK